MQQNIWNHTSIFNDFSFCEVLCVLSIHTIEFFYKHTALAIMPILASEAFLRENKKSQYKNATPVNIELLDLWFQVQHSPFLTYLAFTCKGIPTLNVSGSGKCWSMVTLGNGSGTDFQASSLTSIGHWCWCCADSRCVYIA